MKRRDFIKTGLFSGMGITLLPNISFAKKMSNIKIPFIEKWKCKVNPIYFIENYCTIQNPHKGDILFKLRDQQKQVIYDLQNNRFTLFKKARQRGLSSLFVVFSLWKNIFYNEKILYLSPSLDMNKSAVNKYDKMYHNLPDFLKKPLLYDNKMNKIYKDDSYFRTISALNLKPGCGESVDAVIFDEYGYFNENNNRWTKAEELYFSMIPVISNGGRFIIGSSPYQAKGHFYELWKQKNSAFYKRSLYWIDGKKPEKRWYSTSIYNRDILAKFTN